MGEVPGHHTQVGQSPSAFDQPAPAGANRLPRETYPVLALASAAATLAWIFWHANKRFGYQDLRLWTAFVALSAALVFAPLLAANVRIDAGRAWQFCVAGAAGLGFAWVAFLLPNIQSDQGFIGTLAAGTAALAAWTAPGRPR